MNRILLISITFLLFIGISCASATNLDMGNGDNVVANGDNVSIKEMTKTITLDQLKYQASHGKNKKVTKAKKRPQPVLTRGKRPAPILQGGAIFENVSETDFSRLEKLYGGDESPSDYAEIKKSGKDHGDGISEDIKPKIDPTKPNIDEDFEKYIIKPIDPSVGPIFGIIEENSQNQEENN